MLAMILVIVALVAAIGSIVLYTGSKVGYGTVPMPSASLSSTSSPSTPSTSLAPSADASPLADIAGTPVHITIANESGSLVDADITPIQLDGDGMLVPPAGLAGWYGSPQWSTTPGNLSTYRGIIAGHDIMSSGAKDVFYNLGQAKAHDTVTITYRLTDGSLVAAEFTVTADARAVSKVDVITEAETTYRWVWQSDTPTRTVSIFSCDLSAPQVDGHSTNNWVVQAKRVR